MSVAARPAGRTKVRKRSNGVWKKRFKVAFSIFFVLFAILFIIGSLEAFKRLDKAKLLVPQLDGVMEEMNNSPSEIVSADGVVLFRYQKEYRESVELDDVPELVKNAVLAAEDKRFYQHGGVDVFALGRIAVVALKDREASQGASTLTMQIAKQVYTDSSQTLDRKLDDMAMAIEIERNYSKDRILQLYLNRSYFGAGAYGVVAAADVYFGKELDELTIAEAAMIARCVRRPSDENPFNDLEKSTKNRNVVLKIMLDEGMISNSEYQTAKNEPVNLRDEKPQVLTAKKKAPYFVDFVLKELREKGIDIKRGGYTVYTTLDMGLQEIAVDGVKKALEKNKRYRVNRMAFLATDARGRILTMVPDVDYAKRQFNMMDQPPGRQPGSSFKPFVYAAGIERGAFSARSRISTRPYEIKDDSGRERAVKGGVMAGGGSIGIARALASSNNTAAVQAQALVGTENVINVAENAFGLKGTRLVHSETLALGSSEVLMTEMIGAYSVFQSGGDRVTAYAIERIKMPDGKIVNLQPSIRKGVLSKGTAEVMDSFLRQAAYNGTGRASRAVNNARGKTGTTSSNKDAWFCGYTDKLIAICWMARIEDEGGRPVNKAMAPSLMGGTGAAPAWADIMKQIQAEVGEKSRPFDSAPGATSSDADLGDEEEEITDDDEVVPLEDDRPGEPDDEGPGFVIPPPLPGDPGYNGGSTGGGTSSESSGSGRTSGTTGGGGTRPPGTTGGSGDPPRDLVYVSVCADSGQRSNIYCRESVKRPYVKGTEPKGSCPIHGP